MVDWLNEYVNTNFYGADFSYNENKETIEYEGGRKVYYEKNPTPQKVITVNLTLNDSEIKDGLTEFQWFIYWYENVSGSGTEKTLLTNLITHNGTKAYYLTEPPTWNGQEYKTVSLTFEEA